MGLVLCLEKDTVPTILSQKLTFYYMSKSKDSFYLTTYTTYFMQERVKAV